MISILLALIYLSFISLGLPEPMLGAAWPVMHAELGVSLSYAGIITMIIAACTILSSFLSDKMTKRFNTQRVVIASIVLTAVSLFGFSISTAFWHLCLFAIPFGIGAGSLDAGLNNYVALYYKSRQMNWLHCFWGVGAAIGPYIMGYNLTGGFGWSGAYRTVSIIQFSLVVVLLLTLPLWKKQRELSSKPKLYKPMKFKDIIKVRGVKLALLSFFFLCSIEITAGLWATSFLVLQGGVEPEIAANYASLVFIGIMSGRFIGGFISDKLGDRNMIRLGIIFIILGVGAVWAPVPLLLITQGGLVLTGLGCAPVFPSLIHATSDNFGEENSQAIIGVQMASAYTGITLMPLLFGVIADNTSIALFPLYLLILAGLLLFMTERLNFVVSKGICTENQDERSSHEKTDF